MTGGYRIIDLSRGNEHNHPDISAKKSYLVKVNGTWRYGKFCRLWYGLMFDYGHFVGIQFDAPGFNSSTWEKIIEIDPDNFV